MLQDRERMERITSVHATTSDKIRALDAAGYSRAEIAKFLGKLYQHVRNVLVAGAPKGSSFAQQRDEPAGFEDGGGARPHTIDQT